MPNQTVKNGLIAIKIKLPPNEFFSRKTTNEIFHVPISPFHSAKFKKILSADPELSIFGPKMVHLPQKKIFFGTLIISFSSTY